MAVRLELLENGASFALRDAKEDGVNRLLFKSDPKQPLALNLYNDEGQLPTPKGAGLQRP